MNRTSQAKTALITGGADRIGFALAERYCLAGFRVALTSRSMQRAADSAARLCRRFRPEAAFPVKMHGEDHADVAAAFLSAEAVIGPFDVIAHCAAVFRNDHAERFDPAAFALMMQVNCSAGLHLASLAAQRPNERGTLILYFGDYVTAIAPETFLSYATSKAALTYGMQAAARQLASSGIRPNMIAPGAVTKAPAQRPEHFKGLCERQPLPGPVGLDDLFNAARFLEESRSVTGQILYLDGGARLSHTPYA